MSCCTMFKWISIIVVPVVMVSFMVLLPLSLMATGGFMVWTLFWIPLAAVGMLSFVRSLSCFMEKRKIWSAFAPVGKFLGWCGIVLVGLYVIGVLFRVGGYADLDHVLEVSDTVLLALALLSTIYLHAAIMRLFAFSQRPLTYLLFWFVLACHAYGVFYVFRIFGLDEMGGFMSGDIYLWFFIEAFWFSMAGTILILIYNNPLVRIVAKVSAVKKVVKKTVAKKVAVKKAVAKKIVKKVAAKKATAKKFVKKTVAKKVTPKNATPKKKKA
ncbi:MAG TPA: hypothetical protein QGF02_04080 [Candidatus Babeliales bacterium]|nr:hypothetical protein [Candidatus Babeliales bacterium]